MKEILSHARTLPAAKSRRPCSLRHFGLALFLILRFWCAMTCCWVSLRGKFTFVGHSRRLKIGAQYPVFVAASPLAILLLSNVLMAFYSAFLCYVLLMMFRRLCLRDHFSFILCSLADVVPGPYLLRAAGVMQADDDPLMTTIFVMW